MIFMDNVYLGLGSNLGNRIEMIQLASQQLNEHPHIEVKNVSSIYLTSPVGFKDQPDFYNGVAEIKTCLCRPFGGLRMCLPDKWS